MTKEECLDYLGITKWHEAGYKGQGIKIMSDEKISEDFRTSHTDRLKDVICPTGYASSKGFCHGKEVMVHILMVSPEATCITYPLGGTFSSNSYKSKCVDYILENDVDIFTTSCTGPYPNAGEQKAIQDCIANGCIFFGSAGNEGEGGIMPEIRYDGYWAIGGVKCIDNNWKRVNYSSIGEELDFVTIAEILGVAGTSFCSPVFAAMCGLVQQFFKERVGRKLTRAEMERFIKDNCKDVNIEGFDVETGFGLFILPDPDSIDVSKYVHTNSEVNEMNIRQDLVDSSKYSLKCPNKLDVKYIVVHNTANDASAQNEIKYMKSTNVQTSFHFAVDDKEIVQGIPLDRTAFHAGDGSEGKGNKHGIGIEICYSKSGGERFLQSEKNAVKLIAYLLKEYSLPISAVITHRDCSGKYCPHRTLDMGWDRFVDMIKTEMGEGEEDMPRYKTVEEMPEYYQKDIQELIDRGIIAGRGGDAGLDLSDDMCRMAIYAKKIFENGGK